MTDMNKQIYFTWTDSDGVCLKALGGRLTELSIFQIHSTDLYLPALTSSVE